MKNRHDHDDTPPVEPLQVPGYRIEHGLIVDDLQAPPLRLSPELFAEPQVFSVTNEDLMARLEMIERWLESRIGKP